jgi:hypothetical protein
MKRNKIILAALLLLAAGAAIAPASTAIVQWVRGDSVVAVADRLRYEAQFADNYAALFRSIGASYAEGYFAGEAQGLRRAADLVDQLVTAQPATQ